MKFVKDLSVFEMIQVRSVPESNISYDEIKWLKPDQFGFYWFHIFKMLNPIQTELISSSGCCQDKTKPSLGLQETPPNDWNFDIVILASRYLLHIPL